jgi:hypothetical protein
MLLAKITTNSDSVTVFATGDSASKLCFQMRHYPLLRIRYGGETNTCMVKKALLLEIKQSPFSQVRSVTKQEPQETLAPYTKVTIFYMPLWRYVQYMSAYKYFSINES